MPGPSSARYAFLSSSTEWKGLAWAGLHNKRFERTDNDLKDRLASWKPIVVYPPRARVSEAHLCELDDPKRSTLDAKRGVVKGGEIDLVFLL